jgi:hypothetical protein
MKNAVNKAINRMLTLVLILAILGNGAFAVAQSHVYVQYTFGKQPVEQVALAPAVDMSQLQPLPIQPRPQHKPLFKG